MVIWRKDRDYFVRMQIFGKKYFIAAIDGCCIDTKNEGQGEKKGDKKQKAGVGDKKNEPDCSGS